VCFIFLVYVNSGKEKFLINLFVLFARNGLCMMDMKTSLLFLLIFVFEVISGMMLCYLS